MFSLFSTEFRLPVDLGRKYFGEARAIFCSTTGLTPTYIQNACFQQLSVAANNVGIPLWSPKSKAFDNQLLYLRSALNSFINRRFPSISS